MSEFARAGKGTRTLQNAFRMLLKDVTDHRQASRLTTKLHQVITGDPVHGRGKRTATMGDVSFLEGLDFNSKWQLLRTFYGQFEATIDRDAGQCLIQVAPFYNEHDMRCDTNYTHVEFVAAATAVDFEREHFVTDIVCSKLMDVQDPITVALTATVAPRSKLPIVLVIGIRFYQVINGRSYMMGPKVFTIVKTDCAPRPKTKLKPL